MKMMASPYALSPEIARRIRTLRLRNHAHKTPECLYFLKPPAPPKNCLKHTIQLRGEFFHCCIFADNFTSLSTVQSYLCGD